MHTARADVGIVARAPTRIDFGGGWTDVPPYDREQGGYVCNLAIARYATVQLGQGATSARDGAVTEGALLDAARRRAGLADVPARLTSDFPVGAGLGGSSAAGVALAAACRALRDLRTDDRAALAEESRATEVEELGIAGGRQDHYAAAFGGALGLRFSDRVEVESLADAATLDALTRRLVLVYTGESRISAATITAVLDAYRDREPRVLAALRAMGALAEQMARAIRERALDDVGALVAEHWGHQRALHPLITTPRIERVLALGLGAGATGGKALGASGGGCVVLVAPESRVAAVRAAVAEAGTPLDFEADAGGVLVSACGAETAERVERAGR